MYEADEPFVCSFGVVNCPICMRPRKAKSTAEIAKRNKRVTERVAQALAGGRVRLRITPTGGVAFEGLDRLEREGLTDDVIYRNLIKPGAISPLALAALQRAEHIAGRKVAPRVVGHIFRADEVRNPNQIIQ